MRTKTILLSGVVAALSGASLMAQVYSVNVVGYINVTIPPGFSIVADQLLANGPGVPQTLSPLLDSQIGLNPTGDPSPFNGTSWFKYTAGVTSGSPWTTLTPDSYPATGNVPWDQTFATNTTLNPGEAIFVQNPGSAFTVTFVGTVPQGNLTNNAVAHGFSLVSSIIPQAGRLDADLGFPEVDGDTVFIYNVSTSSHPGYQTYNADSYSGSGQPWDAPGGQPLNPTVAVGQGFFYLATQVPPIAINPENGDAFIGTPGTATSYTNMWVRSFTVQ
jgi:hypothetical protein